VDSLRAVRAKTRRAYDLAAEKYHELFHNELYEKAYDRSLTTLKSTMKEYSPSAERSREKGYGLRPLGTDPEQNPERISQILKER
jgi:hypothetical protein